LVPVDKEVTMYDIGWTGLETDADRDHGEGAVLGGDTMAGARAKLEVTDGEDRWLPAAIEAGVCDE
jgi:hypothetical protein